MPLTKLDTTTALIVIDLQNVNAWFPHRPSCWGKSLTKRLCWLTHSACHRLPVVLRER